MGRAPCCEKVGLKKGRWTAEEDEILMKYIEANGEGSWRSLPKNAGLLRCGKSCRLRWINYLRSDLKRGNISSEEEDTIIKLHTSLGNRWSVIAGHLPGRTDNEIKNYWNSHLSRRIHSFRRPISTDDEASPVVMDLAKMGGGSSKRKGGRTSRAAMKKKNDIPPRPEKKTVMNSIVGLGEERGRMIVGPNKEGDERERPDFPLPCQDNGGGKLGPSQEKESVSVSVSVSVELCPNEERENEMLGPYEGLDTEILCPNDIIMENMVLCPSGSLTYSEERESGMVGSNKMTTSEEGESHVFSCSNGESIEWYSSSSITSCFEDQWADWNWEGVVDGHKLWEDGEQILSWLEDRSW